MVLHSQALPDIKHAGGTSLTSPISVTVELLHNPQLHRRLEGYHDQLLVLHEPRACSSNQYTGFLDPTCSVDPWT